jgi:hypothetical protein
MDCHSRWYGKTYRQTAVVDHARQWKSTFRAFPLHTLEQGQADRGQASTTTKARLDQNWAYAKVEPIGPNSTLISRRVLGLFYLLSQVDVDRLEAKLADGAITSRLEAAIACRPAGTTLRPPARQPEVRMSMCPFSAPWFHSVYTAHAASSPRPCLENPNMVTPGLRHARA